jgi:hypothetical protein
MMSSMVTSLVARAQPPWEDAQFIGGHPVLDLTNTVFNRAHPVEGAARGDGLCE